MSKLYCTDSALNGSPAKKQGKKKIILVDFFFALLNSTASSFSDRGRILQVTYIAIKVHQVLLPSWFISDHQMQSKVDIMVIW